MNGQHSKRRIARRRARNEQKRARRKQKRMKRDARIDKKVSAKSIVRFTARFMKIAVVYSLIFVSVYTVVQILYSIRFGTELTPTLTEHVYAFFGKEIIGTTWIRVVEIAAPAIAGAITGGVGALSGSNDDTLNESVDRSGWDEVEPTGPNKTSEEEM